MERPRVSGETGGSRLPYPNRLQPPSPDPARGGGADALIPVRGTASETDPGVDLFTEEIPRRSDFGQEKVENPRLTGRVRLASRGWPVCLPMRSWVGLWPQRSYQGVERKG